MPDQFAHGRQHGESPRCTARSTATARTGSQSAKSAREMIGHLRVGLVVILSSVAGQAVPEDVDQVVGLVCIT